MFIYHLWIVGTLGCIWAPIERHQSYDALVVFQVLEEENWTQSFSVKFPCLKVVQNVLHFIYMQLRAGVLNQKV